MTLVIPKQLFSRFFSGSERGILAKKNIIASALMKMISILASFIIVPLTINYVNPTKYGIWLTISSFIGWFSLFDIGLTNGFRNRFAEAKALNQTELCKIYLSTTYAILIAIISIIFLSFVIINPFINWINIFNAPKELESELHITMFYVFFFFFLKFVLQVLGSLLIANQQPAFSDFLNLSGSLLSLFVIYILTKVTNGTLINLSCSISASPVIILIFGSIILYNTKYRDYKPSWKYVKMKYARNLVSLGLKFFLIQISYIVLYTTNNMIITQLYGPAEVTPYNIAFRYFNIVLLIFGIVISPFWTAFTDAFHKDDLLWIERIVKRLIFIWFGIVALTIIMLIFSNVFYKFWIKDAIIVPWSMSIVMAIYTIIYSWCTIFSNFLNGVGKIQLQLYTSLIGAIVNIPLAIVLAKGFNFGTAGILMSSVIIMFFASVWSPMQYLKIIKKNAKGIWNK